MSCKKGKFVSKLPQSEDKNKLRKAQRNMQRDFMKSLGYNGVLPLLQLEKDQELSDKFDVSDMMDLNLTKNEIDSIEGVVFSALKRESGDKYAQRAVLEKIGKALKQAADVYDNSSALSGENLPTEYNIILNYLRL